uniref:Uncharacterized protein n=1 Tax=Human betaherpesvirus 6A TaxID=32603 RepID=A0A2L2QA92_9BETA|nr:hypothetical protein [Human betaherpesvirus 6A]AVI07578.1 hypothetical protein [Human betaherpesvirus 6A]AVI07700.1 hypothetical protein [Human betaherpesvirus 6A]AVI07822.1 hypothetical protein [Human betaherpesvirus 6A]AVI07950.1 hypothetical protein [Human betaherpesvirus 6A]
MIALNINFFFIYSNGRNNPEITSQDRQIHKRQPSNDTDIEMVRNIENVYTNLPIETRYLFKHC